MSHSTPSPTPIQDHDRPILTASAAAWYAAHGYSIFPLHTPRRGGCSCGKRNCDDIGKHPRTANGVADATTDAATVAEWWRQWPDANIGIACGPSGLLVLDLDEYKSTYGGGNLLDDADIATVTTITGGGGRHVWYRMPPDATLGNRRGALPSGIDVRGWGGYVVAAPSLHKSGNRYTFAPGAAPSEMAVAPLPAKLRTLIEDAHRSGGGRVAVAPLPVDDGRGAPDITRWHLSESIVNAIHTAHAAPGARSESDFAIVCALVAVGASDADIAAVFRHYPTSGKFHARGRSGDAYLAATIANARTSHSTRQTTAATVDQLRLWSHGAAFAQLLRDHGVKRVADYVRTVDALLEMLTRRCTLRTVVSVRTLGEWRNASHMTVWRHLRKLADIGIVTLGEDAHGTLVDAANLVVVADCGLTVTPCTRTQSVEPVTVTPQSTSPYYGEHRADDAFTPYPAAYAAKRRGVDVDDITRSLSSAALTVASVLVESPECTAQDISARCGLTPGSVRAALRKLDSAGLIIVWRGRPCRYELHPDHAARLDDIRGKMSGYGRGVDIRRHNALARAAFADYTLECAPPQETRAITRLERYQLRNNARAVALDETLREMGFNPRARVAQRAATTKRETIQTVAQTIGKRKTTHHKPTMEDRARWAEYSRHHAAAQSAWPEIVAWCAVTGTSYGAAIFDRDALVDLYLRYLADAEFHAVPTIHSGI